MDVKKEESIQQDFIVREITEEVCLYRVAYFSQNPKSI